MSKDEGFLLLWIKAGKNEEESSIMGEHIKRLNRELKFKGKIIDFYQDTIEVDGSHTVVWDFIKHKGAAAVVPVTEDGKILMVR